MEAFVQSTYYQKNLQQIIKVLLNTDYPSINQININRMRQFTFQFFRHAPSQHNWIKDEWKEKYGDKSFKQAQEFKKIKYSPKLVDSKLILDTVCAETRQKRLNFDKIELVICSPMRRCLETCKSLIKGRQNQVTVIVEPLLSCRIGAAWDIGSSPTLLQEEYPSFNFQNFEKWGELWMFKFFQQSRKMNWPQIEKNKEKWQQYLLEYIQKEGGENFGQFFKRTRPLKKKFLEITSSHNFANINKNDVLVIAHACSFSFMLGKQLANEGKGKIKNKICFSHGEPKTFTSKQVFPQISQKQEEIQYKQ